MSAPAPYVLAPWILEQLEENEIVADIANDDRFFKALADRIAEKKTIWRFDIAGSNIYDDQFSVFVPALCACSSALRHLNVSLTFLGDATVRSFVAVAAACPALDSLSVASCRGVTDASVPALCEILRTSKSLRHLSVYSTRISAKGTLEIARTIFGEAPLVDLVYQRNVPGDDDDVAVLRLLCMNYEVRGSLVLAEGALSSPPTPLSNFLRRDGDTAIQHRIRDLLLRE